MGKVHRITPGDSSPGSVVAMLHEATSDVTAGDRKCQKALLLTLDEDDDRYDVAWYNAGMKGSEIIALLECAKRLIQEKMGF